MIILQKHFIPRKTLIAILHIPETTMLPYDQDKVLTMYALLQLAEDAENPIMADHAMALVQDMERELLLAFEAVDRALTYDVTKSA